LFTGDVTEFENGFVTAGSHAGGRRGGNRVDLRTTGGYAMLRSSRSTETDALECRGNSVNIWRLRNPVCHLNSDNLEVRVQVPLVISVGNVLRPSWLEDLGVLVLRRGLWRQRDWLRNGKTGGLEDFGKG